VSLFAPLSNTTQYKPARMLAIPVLLAAALFLLSDSETIGEAEFSLRGDGFHIKTPGGSGSLLLDDLDLKVLVERFAAQSSKIASQTAQIDELLAFKTEAQNMIEHLLAV
jgi:hypothetical protein